MLPGYLDYFDFDRLLFDKSTKNGFHHLISLGTVAIVFMSYTVYNET